MTRIVSKTDEDLHTRDGSEDVKEAPSIPAHRQRIREEAKHVALDLDHCRPLSRPQLENLALGLLKKLGLAQAYQGFTMVSINNAFWCDTFAAVPMAQRVLLLPHCLRDVALCKGRYDEVGLECVGCGACDLDGLRREAEALGYTVIIAEGTPVVVQLLLSGRASAVLGVACLDSLEKAFRPISNLGIPHMAVPLLRSGCVDTVAELTTVTELLHIAKTTEDHRTRSFLPLLRVAKDLFDPESLGELLAGHMKTVSLEAGNVTPVNVVETLALEWLRAGGKRFRPFVALASYAALKWGGETLDPGVDLKNRFSLGVRRIALAIEVLHKASLIHDVLEDDDVYRYGRETLHRRYGMAAAVNIGDYLIGLGYRLIVAARDELGAECVADILCHLTGAHLKLSRGQGGEIASTGPNSLNIQAQEIQQMYALKTAPAFEAALYAGIRMAAFDGDEMPVEPSVLQRYCRFLGVGYQLLNDLKDWNPDEDNKLLHGQDFLAARPTMLGVLLTSSLDDAGKQLLREAKSSNLPDQDKLMRVRSLCGRAGIFEKANALVQEYHERALAQADAVRPLALAELMRFLVRAVL